jgi:hypothetical protein
MNQDSGSRALAEQFDFVDQEIRRRGFIIPAASRLARERELFVGPDGKWRTIFVDDPQFNDATEALRDYKLFEVILDSFPFPVSDVRAQQKLKVSLCDAVDPRASEDSPGRDAQCELFVAVTMHKAEQKPRFEATAAVPTPDLRGVVAGQAFYVEVKRVKSPAMLLERVKKGVVQVGHSRLPGALHIDVSFLFNRDRKVVDRKLTDEEFRELHGGWLRAQIAPFEREIRTALAGSHIGGIVFQDHVVRRVTETETALYSPSMTFDNLECSDAHKESWLSFIAGLDRAWT